MFSDHSIFLENKRFTLFPLENESWLEHLFWVILRVFLLPLSQDNRQTLRTTLLEARVHSFVVVSRTAGPSVIQRVEKQSIQTATLAVRSSRKSGDVREL